MSAAVITPDTTRRAPRAPVQPLAHRAPAAARACGVSPTTWRRLSASGGTLAPVILMGVRVWPVDELRAWLAAGAPERGRWSMMRKDRAGGQKG